MSIAMGEGKFSMMDEAGEWIELGHTSLECGGFVGESYVDTQGLITTGVGSATFTFEAVGFQRESLSEWLGFPPPEPTHSVLFRLNPEPWPEPRHPVKGWPHVGKKYRQACRRWQRQHKAWRRSDRTQQRVIYIPRARLEVQS